MDQEDGLQYFHAAVAKAKMPTSSSAWVVVLQVVAWAVARVVSAAWHHSPISCDPTNRGLFDEIWYVIVNL